MFIWIVMQTYLLYVFEFVFYAVKLVLSVVLIFVSDLMTFFDISNSNKL